MLHHTPSVSLSLFFSFYRNQVTSRGKGMWSGTRRHGLTVLYLMGSFLLSCSNHRISVALSFHQLVKECSRKVASEDLKCGNKALCWIMAATFRSYWAGSASMNCGCFLRIHLATKAQHYAGGSSVCASHTINCITELHPEFVAHKASNLMTLISCLDNFELILICAESIVSAKKIPVWTESIPIWGTLVMMPLKSGKHILSWEK